MNQAPETGTEPVGGAEQVLSPPTLTSYRLHWFLLFALALVAAWWVAEGSAGLRRRGLASARVPETERTDSHFIAVAVPRVTTHGKDSTLLEERFREIMEELARRGYHTIGFSDLRELYANGRGLPPKSILLAFERDNPESVRLAEKTLRRLHWRAAVFMDRSAQMWRGDIRRALSDHAVSQMLKGGAWDFGTTVVPGSVLPTTGLGREAVLWGVGTKPVRVPQEVPIRLFVTKTGYNDAEMPLTDLRAVQIRPDAPVNETIASIEALQPRREEFVDRFQGEKLGPDWISEWGVIAANRERMALLPQPSQKSASVELKGTDRWRDMVVEFQVLRYKKTAWLYARAREPERWLRAGLENGMWKLQQKTGPDAKPVTLAGAPDREGLPAVMRLILKGPWAIAYVGPKVEFGKGLWVDTAIDHGRVHFVTHDPERWTAKAAFGWVRARPLAEHWVEFAGSPADSPELLERLRAQAAEARVLSPRWLEVGRGGTVRAAPAEDLVRTLAGFYRCRLIPAVTFTAWPRTEDVRPLAEALAEAAERLGVPGVDLRLPPLTPDPTRLARELHAALWARRRLLWVTARTPAQAAAWSQYAEGVLSKGETVAPGMDVLYPR